MQVAITVQRAASLLLLTASCGSSSDDSPRAEGAGATGGVGAAGGAGGSGNDAGVDRRGHQIGTGDGSPSSVTFTVIYEPNVLRSATDLDFNPVRPTELWVVVRELGDELPCTEAVKVGCAGLAGRTLIIGDIDEPSSNVRIRQDQNASHFMRQPTAIAFGPGDTFGTCHEARTANFTDSQPDYIGPTLWSSDPSIYAVSPSPGGNGSHLDMIHGTAFCMGMAHERDNVYWTFNGQLGAIDRYDFKQPHVPGGDDHSDGELLRYVEGELLRVAGVPSHLDLDSSSGTLYIADTGHGRIVKLDTTSGSEGSNVPVADEQIRVRKSMLGASLAELVAPGVLEAPSGLALHEGVLFATDNATSRIYAFDLEGRVVRTLDTGLPPRSLAGIAIGPDDRVYFVDLLTSHVRRIDPTP